MSLPNLTLQTDKNNTSVDIDRITIRQSESGLVLIADLITATGEAYDLTDCSIAFGENKDGGKMVSDDNVDIIDAKNGRISYCLNTVVYQESGDAWFEITDTMHKLIDTTVNIRIDVVKQADLPVDNDNYWSKAEGMLTHVQAIMDKMQNDFKANVSSNDYKLNNFINSFNKKLDDYKTELADYDDKFKKLSDDWASKLADIQSSATQAIKDAVQSFDAQKKSIQADAGAAIAQIDTDKQAAINKASADFNAKLDSIQTDYNSWKSTTIADFQKQIDKLNDDLSNAETTQDNLKAAIDSAMAAVDKIKGVDFTKYVLKEDLDKFYDKTTIDEKLKNAGTLKQISVNGGTPINPDEKGVANIAIAIPDVKQIQQDIITLQNEMKEQKSKVTYHYADSLQEGQDYSTANPQILTGTP